MCSACTVQQKCQNLQSYEQMKWTVDIMTRKIKEHDPVNISWQCKHVSKCTFDDSLMNRNNVVNVLECTMSYQLKWKQDIDGKKLVFTRSSWKTYGLWFVIFVGLRNEVCCACRYSWKQPHSRAQSARGNGQEFRIVFPCTLCTKLTRPQVSVYVSFVLLLHVEGTVAANYTICTCRVCMYQRYIH